MAEKLGNEKGSPLSIFLLYQKEVTELNIQNGVGKRQTNLRFCAIIGISLLALAVLCTCALAQENTSGYWIERAEELSQNSSFEEAAIACIWAESLHKQYEPADFQVFERWVHNYVTNWAACDTLCNHTIGTFIMMYPDYIAELKKWATSSNLWVKRASSVTLIIPARKGLFLDDIFQIALILLHDNNDLVQKGYGWMLKAASEAHQKEVFDFVVKQKATMPRTALRYAIEKMPADMKAEAMRKDILNI